MLVSTSINFDVSVAEIFGTLCWGGKLVLVENALELAAVAEQVIRYASMVPTAAAELLRSGAIPAERADAEPGRRGAAERRWRRTLYALGTVETGGQPLRSDGGHDVLHLLASWSRAGDRVLRRAAGGEHAGVRAGRAPPARCPWGSSGSCTWRATGWRAGTRAGRS